MTKEEMIARVAHDAGLTKVAAREAVKAVMESIVLALRADGKFTLSDFGTFTVSEKAEREMNSFGRGKIKVPACNTVKFRPAPALKNVVNQ
jgi:DNA-binding protein HU-beta